MAVKTNPVTDSLVYRSYDPWWKRPDPASLVPLGGDDAFWAALAATGGCLLVTSRSQGMAAIVSGSARGGVAAVVPVPGPMGAAVDGTALAIGTADGIRIYQNLAGEGTGEGVFVPAAFHFTGRTSVHDVGWDSAGKLWFVNTRFSTLCTVEPLVQFAVRWRPSFLAEICDGDSCHLNGMAMSGGRPAYVTALGETGSPSGWREFAPGGGILMTIDQEIIRRGLCLPHSPVAREDGVFLVESGRGRLMHVSADGKEETEICEFPGLVRGLAPTSGHWFLGLSRIRDSSGHVAAELEQAVGDIDTARLIALDIDRGVPVGEVALPFISEISSITLLPMKSARIAEPMARDFDQFWVFTVDR